jgi:hypothetical protein
MAGNLFLDLTEGLAHSFFIPRSQVRSLPGPFTTKRTRWNHMVEPGNSCDVCQPCEMVLFSVLSSRGARLGLVCGFARAGRAVDTVR